MMAIPIKSLKVKGSIAETSAPENVIFQGNIGDAKRMQGRASNV
jgi:hypothetical protein